MVRAKVVGLHVRSPYLVTSFERERRFGGDGVAGPVRLARSTVSMQMVGVAEARGFATRCGRGREARSGSSKGRHRATSGG